MLLTLFSQIHMGPQWTQTVLELVTLRCTASLKGAKDALMLLPLVYYNTESSKSASPDNVRVNISWVSCYILLFLYPSLSFLSLYLFPNEPFAMQLERAGHVLLDSETHWADSGSWDPVCWSTGWEGGVVGCLTLCSWSYGSGQERTWKYRKCHEKVN